MRGPTAERRRARAPVRLFVVVYLLLQLTVPLGGLFRAKQDTRGDFSWNMYADMYVCHVLYTLREPDGILRTIDHRPYFRNAASSTRILHRDVIDSFHHWLCTEHSGRIEGLVSCSANGGPWRDVVEPGVDLCAEGGPGAD